MSQFKITQEYPIAVILEQSCKHFDIPIIDIFKKDRKLEHTYPRQVIHYLCLTLNPNCTQELISFYIGNKERSTVAKSRKTISNLLDVDHKVQRDVNVILNNIIQVVNNVDMNFSFN